MTREAQKRLADTLPPYLGLGTLDPSSTYENNGKVEAKDTSGAETIYDVSVSAQQSEIVEYFQGTELSRSIGQGLGDAFFHHMMSLPIGDHPRLQELFAEITTGRNINVVTNPKHKFVMYPGGISFVLRLPVTGSNRATWEAFSGWHEDCGDTAPLRPEKTQEGHILKLSSQGDVFVESVTIAECSTLLIRLKPAVDQVMESGLVLNEKKIPSYGDALSGIRCEPAQDLSR